MNVLRTIEQKIEGLFEGLFGRAFRTNVQPVELARKLVKEMEDHRTVSVSRVYVPNEYTVYLSSPDREQFTSYEGSLCNELQDYLAEHARREGYALLTPPAVSFETDDDLSIGEFGIATRMVQGAAAAAGAAEEAAPAGHVAGGATMVYKPRQQPTEAVSAAELGVEQERVAIAWDDRSLQVEQRRVLIGRSRECDVQLADPNVSRRHAELRQEGASYWIVDLDSTNGIEVNGRKLKRSKLESGDRVTLGSTELVFTRERTA